VSEFQPGDPEYRAFVGPFDQYDVMGATQFALLFALGLRQTHRFLDIGCGSLRAGRLFIAYLDPGNYVGVEPNQWLIEEAIKKHARPGDHEAPLWLYPGCYSYERAAVDRWVTNAGLVGWPVPWYHPRQTWWLLARDAAALPPADFVQCLSGASLAQGFERSWHA
jgi:hypothetical protein